MLNKRIALTAVMLSTAIGVSACWQEEESKPAEQFGSADPQLMQPEAEPTVAECLNWEPVTEANPLQMLVTDRHLITGVIITLDNDVTDADNIQPISKTVSSP